MEVTCSSLTHERRLHRRLFISQECIDTLHIIKIVQDKLINVDQTTRILENFKKSLDFFTVKVSFDFLLHPTFLSIVNDCEVTAFYQDSRGRFSILLKEDKKIIMKVAKEMYEKLGLEGRKMNKSKSEFIIEIDLTASNMQVGQRVRMRLLENVANVLKMPLKIHFACSKTASTRLNDLLYTLKIQPQLEDLAISTTEHDVSVPEIRIATDRLPKVDELEELGLWLGALTCDANIVNGTRVDPFISTCQLPDGGEKHLFHSQLTIKDSIIPSLSIAELLEALTREEGDWTNLILTGTDQRGGGFSFYLDKALNFVFCNV